MRCGAALTSTPAVPPALMQSPKVGSVFGVLSEAPGILEQIPGFVVLPQPFPPVYAPHTVGPAMLPGSVMSESPTESELQVPPAMWFV